MQKQTATTNAETLCCYRSQNKLPRSLKYSYDTIATKVGYTNKTNKGMKDLWTKGTW